MPDYRLDVIDRIATLTLARPARKNALTIPMVDAMAEAVAALADRDDVNVLVVTGEGGDFCAGADLTANFELIQGGVGIDGSMAIFHKLLRAVWGFPRPSLAVVSGDAVGFGMDLALACDMRLVSETARFSQGFSKIALVPDGGSSLSLQRLVGTAKAFELMYLSERIDASEALRIGLVNRVVPADDLAAVVADWTGRLAAGPQKAFRLGKQNLRASLGAAMDDALDHEARAQIDCFSGSDPMTGVGAWMSRSVPSFTER